MDTVQEETSVPSSPTNSTMEVKECQPLMYETSLAVMNPDNVLHKNSYDGDQNNTPSALSSRRPSAIIAALRRPSQAIALSAAHAVMSQRRYLMGLFQGQTDRSMGPEGGGDPEREKKLKKHNRKLGDDALTTILSALYAKLLVVLGMAFPITEIISNDVRPFFYQGFYLYLYLGSISFVAYMYATLIREKAVFSIIRSYDKDNSDNKDLHLSGRRTSSENLPPVRYGSFYLRLGAIAFGIGSMVYSGLEFGRYFELRNYPECHSSLLQAITPASRMLLTLVQVQFIFLNSKDLELNRHKIIARFGLMHMIATNLCEWLYVLVEETKHEIIHLSHNQSNESTSDTTTHAKYCQEGNVMGSLVTNASAFLFPCKIEYSLICAVILFEMWKKVKTVKVKIDKEATKSPVSNLEKNTLNIGQFTQSNHHFSVDCSNSHRGLFGGILVIVLTIISLIMFFVLTNEAQTTESKLHYQNLAEFEVNIVELVLYIISTTCVVVAMFRMRDLKYDRKLGEGHGLGLDNTLLVVAQTGVFIYCMFSIIACYFTLPMKSPASLLAEIFSLIQTCLQTMFVLDGWWRRSKDIEQAKRKPGRELVTFLIVVNMAMWTINSLMKNRAEFRPTHLKFFGDWAWTIITHISMPLAIFYRFHSTICLFEIWKSAYKIKRLSRNNPLLSYL